MRLRLWILLPWMLCLIPPALAHQAFFLPVHSRMTSNPALRRAWQEMSQGHYDKARKISQACAADRSQPAAVRAEAWLYVAQVAQVQADRHAAYPALLSAVALDPTDELAQYLLREYASSGQGAGRGIAEVQQERLVTDTEARILLGAVLVALALSMRVASRRKQTLKAIHQYTEGLAAADSVRSLASLLAERLQPCRASLWVYRTAAGQIEQALGGTVFSAAALPWLPTHTLLPVSDIERDLPDLALHLRSQQITHVMPLHHAQGWLGFVALAPRRGGLDLSGARLLQKGVSAALSALVFYEISVRDELTGLYNRRFFNRTMEALVAAGKPFSVITFDVDNFKKINDSYGHDRGDLVLKTIASRVTSVLRSGLDIVARTGGEEFYVILPDTDHGTAVHTAERLRETVQQAHYPGASVPLTVTISVGAATLPQHGATAEELQEACDAAQYQAKREGKNRVVSAASARPPALRPVRTSSEFLGLTDAVSGLFTPAYFALRLEQELCRQRRLAGGFGLVVLGLSEGTDLAQAGLRVRETLRDGLDMAGHLDDRTIALILPGVDPRSVPTAIERVAVQFHLHRLPTFDSGFSCDPTLSAQQLLAQAEASMQAMTLIAA